MSIGSWIAIYFIVWWTILFAALPFAVRRGEPAAEVVAGSDPGAPVRPRLGAVLLATTALTVPVVGLIYLALTHWPL